MKHHWAKLTEAIVLDVRRRYAAGEEFDWDKDAEKYGVCGLTLKTAATGVSW
jgi:hypothetical protein